MTEVYLNNKFVGEIDNAVDFVHNIREERRKESISDNVNVFLDELLKREKVQVGSGERHGGVNILGKNSLAYGHIRPALVQDIDLLEESANRIERFVKNI